MEEQNALHNTMGAAGQAYKSTLGAP